MQRPVLSAGLIGDVAHDLWSADIGILPGLRRPTQYNYRLLYHGFLRTCSGDSCVSELPFIGGIFRWLMRIRPGNSHAGARYPTAYRAGRSMSRSSLEPCST